MKKYKLDNYLQRVNFKIKEEILSLSKIRDVIFRYKLLVFGVMLFSSCDNSRISSESHEILQNPLDKHRIAKIYGIDIFKDTLIYKEDSKYIYNYRKFTDSLDVKNKIKKLNNWLDKYPPGFLEEINLNKVFIQEKITVKSKKTGEITNPTGLYYARIDNLSLTDMDEFPHELVHKILEEIDFNYEEWARNIYGDNFAEFYGKPKQNEQGYYPRLDGFINNNASRSYKEDWAETIHDLMTKNVWKTLLNDKMLQKKIKSMKKVFFSLDNRFTEQYWKDLEAGEINKQYWENK